MAEQVQKKKEAKKKQLKSTHLDVDEREFEFRKGKAIVNLDKFHSHHCICLFDN